MAARLSGLEGSAVEVAPLLLGARVTLGGVTLRLTEVEAYAGSDDPGSHAFRGRTQRNASMFGPAGTLYVYFTYGMHHCANVVVGREGDPGAVLLRAGEVVDGLDLARVRRPGSSDRDLARGPARLCRALAVDRSLDGADLAEHLALGRPLAADTFRTGPRVGLRHAADRPWRFWIEGDPTVSRYRPATPRRSAPGPDRSSRTDIGQA
ncbi:DNA-3-methyladenine glycosylase [Alteromonas gracilis]